MLDDPMIVVKKYVIFVLVCKYELVFV